MITLKSAIFCAAMTFSLSVSAGTVSTIGSSSNEPQYDYTEFCRTVNDQLEDVRSRQRVRSTQYLRDEYNRLWNLRSKHCMKGY